MARVGLTERRMINVTAAPTRCDLQDFYEGRRILLTGHTGFKGGWLACWLNAMGAQVYAFALPPDQGPDNLFERAGIANNCLSSRFADICNQRAMKLAFEEAKPSLVLHLGARSLVQHGFEDPVRTFAVNTLGTAVVLEEARLTSTVEAVVCVTTDKVYNNREWAWPFRENDELGGRDVYSASKAAAELVARAYQGALKPSDRHFAVATARGGNVIGGGDWSPHRLIPDIVRSIRAGEPLELRHPKAVRPWQHVLDLCYAYLLLGRHLAHGAAPDEGSAWNFGPAASDALSVEELAGSFLAAWGLRDYSLKLVRPGVYEALTLRLDASLAFSRLGWRPVLDTQSAVAWTAEWYRDYISHDTKASTIMLDQIHRFGQMLDTRELAA